MWLVGAVIAAAVGGWVSATMAYRYRQHRTPPADENPQIELLRVETEAERADLYKYCIRHIREAEQAIYKTGRGISRFSGMNKKVAADVVKAEHEAADRGVEILRIQLGPHVSGDWAQTYAELARAHPESVTVYEDFQKETSITVAVIDPEGDRPVVEMLFENRSHSGHAERFKTVAALFVYGSRDLAKSLKDQHEERAQRLETEGRRMTPEKIHALGYDYLYFAYGNDVDPAHMVTRAPESSVVCWGDVGGWRRDFWVRRPGHAGSWPGIVEEAGRSVVGVLYAITSKDRTALDSTIGPRYRHQDVRVTCSNEEFDAFTYVPTDPFVESQPPHDSTLDRIIAAAEAAGMTELVAELLSFRNPPPPDASASDA